MKIKHLTAWYLMLCILIPVCILTTNYLQAYHNYNKLVIEPVGGVNEETAVDIKIAAETAIRYFAKNGNLHLETPLIIVVTPNRQRYINEVMQRMCISEKEAETVTAGTDATTTGSIIIVDSSAISNPEQKIFLLAHEITHQFQWQIAGCKVNNNMWLVEGMAEAAGALVAESKGYCSFAQYRNNWRQGLMTEKKIPSLNNLQSASDFKNAIINYGSMNTYKTAGLAVVVLIDDFGEQKVWNYFARIGRGENASLAFRNAFGISIEEFIKKYNKTLR